MRVPTPFFKKKLELEPNSLLSDSHLLIHDVIATLTYVRTPLCQIEPDYSFPF